VEEEQQWREREVAHRQTMALGREPAIKKRQ